MLKPTGIKVILILNYISAGLMSLVIALIWGIYALPESNAVKTGFFSSLVGNMGSVTPELVAQFTGTMIAPLLIVICTIIFILKRKKVAAIITIILQIGSGLNGGKVLLIFGIIMLGIILLDKKSQAYLKVKN